jgi:hypothetical protein
MKLDNEKTETKLDDEVKEAFGKKKKATDGPLAKYLSRRKK